MPRKKAAIKWERANGGYESKPLAYRIAKVKGGFMVYGHCAWIAERGDNPWKALYQHPFRSIKETKDATEVLDAAISGRG